MFFDGHHHRVQSKRVDKKRRTLFYGILKYCNRLEMLKLFLSFKAISTKRLKKAKEGKKEKKNLEKRNGIFFIFYIKQQSLDCTSKNRSDALL